MMDTGVETRPTTMENILTTMELYMKEDGKMISNMVKELRSGMRVVNMRVTITTERKKDGANMTGSMDQFTRENGLITEFKAVDTTGGKMVADIMASGKPTTWRVSVLTAGQMAEGTKASTTTTRNVDMACTTG